MTRLRFHPLPVAINRGLSIIIAAQRMADASRKQEPHGDFDREALRAKLNEGRDPDAAPMSGEAAVRYAPRKRIRVRSKPLTAADIVEGGVYVPKRGNDKTPNFVIDLIDASYPGGTLVFFHKGGKFERSNVFVDEFLALVSRRVEA